MALSGSAGGVQIDRCHHRQANAQRMGDLDAETLKWISAAHNDGALDHCYPGVAALQLEALISGLALWPQVSMRRGTLSAEEQRQFSREIVDMFLARYAP